MENKEEAYTTLSKRKRKNTCADGVISFVPHTSVLSLATCKQRSTGQVLDYLYGCVCVCVATDSLMHTHTHTQTFVVLWCSCFFQARVLNVQMISPQVPAALAKRSVKVVRLLLGCSLTAHSSDYSGTRATAVSGRKYPD